MNLKPFGPRTIRRSSDAVEDLFRFSLRRWSGALGVSRLAKTLGIGSRRLRRMMRQSTPPFELAYRLHRVCGLSWPDLFTSTSRTQSPYVAATEEMIAAAKRTEDMDLTYRAISGMEDRIRARLREIVRQIGVNECAKKIAVPSSTLQYQLESTRLSLALLWRLHLLSGMPYGRLIAGEEQAEEMRLRKAVEDAGSETDRFADVHEPVVRLVEVHVYRGEHAPAGPLVPVLKSLLRGKLTFARRMRLLRLLTMYYYHEHNRRMAREHASACWRELRKRGEYSGALLSHAAMAVHMGLLDHAVKVARHIQIVTRRASAIAQARRILADVAMQRMEISRAADFSRRALEPLRRGSPALRQLVVGQLEMLLAQCAWLMGDYREALWRTGNLLNFPMTLPTARRNASELELNVHIWLRNVAGAKRALRRLRRSLERPARDKTAHPTLAVYELRLLLMRRDAGGPLSAAEQRRMEELLEGTPPLSEDVHDSEAVAVQAVCVYRARGNKEGLLRLLRKIRCLRPLRHGAVHYALPDFVETVREAGLWTAAAQKWKSRVLKKGCMFFGMRRPDAS